MEREFIDEATALLSVAIGTIMEDEVAAAVSALPGAGEARAQHFAALQRAGQDIAALAMAAEALLRRAATGGSDIPLD